MIARLLSFFMIVVLSVLFQGCSRDGGSETRAATQTFVEQSSDKQPEWELFGLWAIRLDGQFNLDEACKRPDFQFGKNYLYQRGDVDGDPHEELDRIESYSVDGAVFKAKLLEPTSIGGYLHSDEHIWLEKKSDGSMFLIHPKYPNFSLTLIKCTSSPVPYSADVPPTPPRYDDIAPGIVDKPIDSSSVK